MNRPFVSPNYENIYTGGYASLNKDNAGEYFYELPAGERYRALPIGLLRTTVPGLEAFERVGVGSIDNLINNGQLRPYDALYDTSLGGYNYNEGFYKNPKGWSPREQVLRNFFPLQQESIKKKKKVKTKRKIKE